MYYLFFDTETTGKPKNYNAPMTDVENFPRLVQLGYIVMRDGEVVKKDEFIIKPDGFTIPEEVSRIHGITQEKAMQEGTFSDTVLSEFLSWLVFADVVVGHNVEFDVNVVGAECIRAGRGNPFENKKTVCTMRSSTDYCKLINPHYGAGGYKFPKLTELWYKLFGTQLPQTHTALDDIQHTATCFFELERLGVIKLEGEKQ